MHAWRTLTIRKGDAGAAGYTVFVGVLLARGESRLACTADRELIIIRICFLLGESWWWCGVHTHRGAAGTQAGSAPAGPLTCMHGGAWGLSLPTALYNAGLRRSRPTVPATALR